MKGASARLETSMSSCMLNMLTDSEALPDCTVLDLAIAWIAPPAKDSLDIIEVVGGLSPQLLLELSSILERKLVVSFAPRGLTAFC